MEKSLKTTLTEKGYLVREREDGNYTIYQCTVNSEVLNSILAFGVKFNGNGEYILWDAGEQILNLKKFIDDQNLIEHILKQYPIMDNE